MRKISAFLYLVCFFSGAIYAQNTVSKQISTPVLIEGTPALAGTHTRPIILDPLLAGQRTRVKSAQFYIHVAIDQTYLLGARLDGLELACNLEQYDGGGMISEVDLNFSLDQNRAEQVYKYNFSEELEDDDVTFKLTDLVLSSVAAIGDNPTQEADLLAYINQYITVKTWYEIDRGVDVRTNALDYYPPPYLESKSNLILENRVQLFEWSPHVYTLEDSYISPNYQFQLLKLENNDPTITDTNRIKAVVDWSKAMTLETYSSLSQLQITVAEGTGFYLWRIRPIGDYYSGGIADSRNWGEWSEAYNDGASVEFTAGVNPGGHIGKCMFYLADPDDEKNWIYSRAFTENGNIHEGMTYANSLLQPVQSQAYSSSTGNVITSQSVNDYLGRPSVSTLPVPTADFLEGYKEKFVVNASGELYTAGDFDTDELIHNPSTIGEDSEVDAFDYYSEDNEDKSIPDAQGYPYSRTIFKNDGSGRPIEQSGVGKVHAIGQITDGNTHTTKVYYATPSDYELIAVFGDEAPPAANVLKTYTEDPNGTVSIVYTTLEGKTIATAMTNSNPENLQNIEDETDQLNIGSNFNITYNTFNSNRQFTSSEVFPLLDEVTPLVLSYQIDCEVLTEMCSTPNCDYRLKFEFINTENGDYYVSDEIEIGDGCGTLIDFTSVVWNKKDVAQPDLNAVPSISDVELELPRGTWRFRKIIKSGANIDNLESDSPLSKLKPLMDIVSAWMSEVSNAEQHAAFMIKVIDLEGDIANAHVSAIAAHGADYTNTDYQNHSEFVAIRTDYGLETDYVFDPEYVLEIPTDGDGDKYVSFTAGCCDEIAVDIPKIPANVICDPINTKITEGDPLLPEDMMFTQLFRDFFLELVELELASDEDFEWENVAPGYGDIVEVVVGEDVIATSDLDVMAANMLTNQYYTGRSIENGVGDWITWESKDELIVDQVLIYPSDDIPVDADQELYGPYYTCNELYDCWYASMKTYYELSSMNGLSLNVYDSLNIVLDPDGEEDPSADHADDPESGSGESGFMAWLTDFVISRKMKKLSDEGAGDDPDDPDAGPTFAININAIDLMFECSGKKIAAIDGPAITDEVNYSIFQDDIIIEPGQEKIYVTYYDEDEEEDVLIDPVQMVYPFVTRPIWAFKYFEYYPGIEIDIVVDDTVLTEKGYGPGEDDSDMEKIPGAELLFCYHDISGVNMCFAPSCEGDYHNWDAENRYQFYQMIKYAKESPLEEDDLIDDDDLECLTDTELLALRTAEFDQAKEACSNRELEYRSSIEDMLEANCIRIEACFTGETDVVSVAQVDEMVQSVIDGCLAYVDAIELDCEPAADADPSTYPTCDLEECNIWTGSGVELRQELTITLFDPAKKTAEKLFYVKFGDFVPTLTVGCQCVYPDECPEEEDWEGEEEDCTVETPGAILPVSD